VEGLLPGGGGGEGGGGGSWNKREEKDPKNASPEGRRHKNKAKDGGIAQWTLVLHLHPWWLHRAASSEVVASGCRCASPPAAGRRWRPRRRGHGVGARLPCSGSAMARWPAEGGWWHERQCLAVGWRFSGPTLPRLSSVEGFGCAVITP
jgi:hypothetical protein